MDVGFLTVPFASVDDAIACACACDVHTLELAHSEVERVQDAGIEVAALARYGDFEQLEPHIRAAAEHGVPTVSTLAGFPEHRDRLRDVLGAAVELAGELGVKLAFENWYRTNLRTLDDWRWFFGVFPEEHVGLVFDPSHLEWQGIDWEAALEEFRERVVFAHAKDVAYHDAGQWRYVLPGRGVIDWSHFAQLYGGFVSIEHEDDEIGATDGMRMAAEVLRSA